MGLDEQLAIIFFVFIDVICLMYLWDIRERRRKRIKNEKS